MRKMLLIVTLLLILMGSVRALQTIPVPVDVTVDFRGDRSFTILMANGLERQFTWTQNQTPADTSIKHSLYYEVDEIAFCKKYADLGTHINLSNGMVDMLKVCKGALNSWNDTTALRYQITEAIKDRDIYDGMLQVCEDNLKANANFTNQMRADATKYRTEADNCQKQVNALEQSNKEFSSCSTELADAVKSKSNNLFMGVGIGVGIGYLLWKRKKDTDAPSEQAEAGVGFDAVGYSRRPPNMTFKDGPQG